MSDVKEITPEEMRAISLIKSKRQLVAKNDSQSLQNERLNFLTKLNLMTLDLIKVTEMYPVKNFEGNVHTTFQVPQYLHEIE